MPVSDALMPDSTHSHALKLELALDHLLASWSLLVSTPTRLAHSDTHEFDQTARAIQQAFAHFVHLMLTLQETDVNNAENDKVQSLVQLFMSRFIESLSFDPAAAKHNPNSHMLIYVPKLVEKFAQCLLKFEIHSVPSLPHHTSTRSHLSLLGLVYTLLNVCESKLRKIYAFDQSEKFVVLNKTDINKTPSTKPKNTNKVDDNIDADSLDIKNVNTTANSTTSKDSSSILVKTSSFDRAFDFPSLLLEQCWLNLRHYVLKYQSNSSAIEIKHNLDLLLLLVERRLQKFPCVTTSSLISIDTKLNQRKHNNNNNNKGDFIYLDRGDSDQAIDEWSSHLGFLFEQINLCQNMNGKLVVDSIKIAHKIFYACLIDYKVDKLVEIINRFFLRQTDYDDDEFSLFSLNVNTFKHLRPPKPLKRAHMAAVCLVKSLTRFVANYLSDNKPHLFVYTVRHPLMMPALFSAQNNNEQVFYIKKKDF